MHIEDIPSHNQDDRPCAIDMLVLHYTGMQTAAEAIDRLRDPEARVSSHYVIDEDGTVIRMVPEARRAFHAGISFWRGRRVLNDPSIGIEIVNPGHQWGYRPFPPAQMQAVRALCQEILGRHAIPPRNVVGHSDIAPTRKQDPGELFDWQGLAAAGIGIWPGADTTPCPDLAATLREIGYEFADEADITAFQRHWLPDHLTGVADEATRVRAEAVRQAVLF